MANLKRIRETVRGPLTPEHIREKERAGWKLVAVEWERPAEGEQPEGTPLVEDVPYGLRVADDCAHLEENPDEKRVLVEMLELIIQETPWPEVAAELNRRGLHTRDGKAWSPVRVFQMVPRLVEVGPQIFPTQEWAARRKRLFRMVGD